MKNPNDYKKQRERSLTRKNELIILRGGKCSECGYDKNFSALEFHHLNPNEKDFPLDSRRLSNTSIDKLMAEVNKCVLLCSNCHRERHNPELSLENVKHKLLNLESEHISVHRKIKKKKCKYCGGEFENIKGKLYCSDACREKDKNYPSYKEVTQKYSEFGSWADVARFFNITPKIITHIRKINKC
jgi:hypothetical protein